MKDMLEARISTGVSGIDDMLCGGLISGRPYVVSGTTGSGSGWGVRLRGMFVSCFVRVIREIARTWG